MGNEAAISSVDVVTEFGRDRWQVAEKRPSNYPRNSELPKTSIDSSTDTYHPDSISSSLPSLQPDSGGLVNIGCPDLASEVSPVG